MLLCFRDPWYAEIMPEKNRYPSLKWSGTVLHIPVRCLHHVNTTGTNSLTYLTNEVDCSVNPGKWGILKHTRGVCVDVCWCGGMLKKIMKKVSALDYYRNHGTNENCPFPLYGSFQEFSVATWGSDCTCTTWSCVICCHSCGPLTCEISSYIQGFRNMVVAVNLEYDH